MKGYAKIKENNLFSKTSKSNTQYPFIDQDFVSNSSEIIGHLGTDDHNPYLSNQKTQQNKLKPNVTSKVNISEVKTTDRKWDRRSALNEKYLEEGKMGSTLKRNFSSKTSFGYGKSNNIMNESGKSSDYLERQGSKRVVVIQEAVKRAFSMRRCSSVNNNRGNSDRYSRIYDQPSDVGNGDFEYVDDYDDEEFGSVEMRSKDQKSKGSKKFVGSKVVRACKRFFSP